jgi:hypothetical protein
MANLARLRLENRQCESCELFQAKKAAATTAGDVSFEVGLGFSADAEFDIANNMVGWQPGSIGYHSNNGGVFHGTGAASNTLPKWSAGVKVGAGYRKSTKSVYFTVNGSQVGQDICVNFDKSLHPLITMKRQKSNAGFKVKVLTETLNEHPEMILNTFSEFSIMEDMLGLEEWEEEDILGLELEKELREGGSEEFWRLLWRTFANDGLLQDKLDKVT